MLRGLEGRRVALGSWSGETEAEARLTTEVIQALEGAGATVHRLSPDAGDTDFHGAKYAALVILGDSGAVFGGDPRVVQLTREFLASDKPVTALGSALSVILDAGGAAGRAVAAHAPLGAALDAAGARRVDEGVCVDHGLITARGDVTGAEFTTRLVRELADALDESAVDETSDLSFPASDPPALTPATATRPAPERHP